MELSDSFKTIFKAIIHNFRYSRHSSRILRGVEKNSRQPEFELKMRPSKPEDITGSQGMVKNTFQQHGKGGALFRASDIFQDWCARMTHGAKYGGSFSEMTCSVIRKYTLIFENVIGREPK